MTTALVCSWNIRSRARSTYGICSPHSCANHIVNRQRHKTGHCYLAHIHIYTAIGRYTQDMENNMELNTSKTKEMDLGPIARPELAPPLLTTPAGTIERVHSFKLLGVHIESSLCWSTHINSILKKVTRRIYFLKQLKRAGLSSTHLLEYSIAVIRPVLKYCVPVCHHALTKEQSKQIEAIQKRAIHIIFNFTRRMPYTSMIYAANINTLASRRHDICKRFFRGITQPSSCLHYLLPAPREQSLTARFRSVQKYPRVDTRTSRYCSFINYSLNNYQDKITNPI